MDFMVSLLLHRFNRFIYIYIICHVFSHLPVAVHTSNI